jgi:hypothetical protein
MRKSILVSLAALTIPVCVAVNASAAPTAAEKVEAAAKAIVENSDRQIHEGMNQLLHTWELDESSHAVGARARASIRQAFKNIHEAIMIYADEGGKGKALEAHGTCLGGWVSLEKGIEQMRMAKHHERLAKEWKHRAEQLKAHHEKMKADGKTPGAAANAWEKAYKHDEAEAAQQEKDAKAFETRANKFFGEATTAKGKAEAMAAGSCKYNVPGKDTKPHTPAHEEPPHKGGADH